MEPMTVLENMAVPALCGEIQRRLDNHSARWIHGAVEANSDAALVDTDGNVLVIVYLDDEDFEVIDSSLEEFTEEGDPLPYLSDRFTVLDNPDPVMDQQFQFDEVKDRNPRTVWTIVEGDSGRLYASAGFHLVNKLHYVVTEEEWTEQDETTDYRW
jgi:hypothetical protein